jgi:hypothetical protein
MLRISPSVRGGVQVQTDRLGLRIVDGLISLLQLVPYAFFSIWMSVPTTWVVLFFFFLDEAAYGPLMLAIASVYLFGFSLRDRIWRPIEAKLVTRTLLLRLGMHRDVAIEVDTCPAGASRER